MAMNIEAEIRDLKRRVSELEGSFGFLMEQVKGVHGDLLGFQARTEVEFDEVHAEIQAVKDDVQAVRDDLRALREAMPNIVGTAMREVLRPGKS